MLDLHESGGINSYIIGGAKLLHRLLLGLSLKNAKPMEEDMHTANTKRIGAMAAAMLIAATGMQAVAATPAHAFSSSGAGTNIVQHVSNVQASVSVAPAERMVLDQINAYRIQNGLHPISQDDGFSNGARSWAQHLSDTGSPAGHPEGGNFYENVAYTLSPERAVELWANSPGHNSNMLEPSITHGGVGIAPRADGTHAVVFRGLWEPAGAANSKGHPAW